MSQEPALESTLYTTSDRDTVYGEIRVPCVGQEDSHGRSHPRYHLFLWSQTVTVTDLLVSPLCLCPSRQMLSHRSLPERLPNRNLVSVVRSALSDGPSLSTTPGSVLTRTGVSRVQSPRSRESPSPTGDSLTPRCVPES